MQTTAASARGDITGRPHLKRVLNLWDLVYYGIILTSPIAAVPLFGAASALSRARGHHASAGHDGNVGDCHQLWPHGQRLSIGRFRLFLRQ